ncbi:MAG: FAD-binding protein [Pseudodesulfovibrio sp.]|uniref:Fumarate reductase/succinate dehydrogenase flavoprotein domain protein n=1 Tax=Pseudodesulfovibrio aespoeensis (strain ATCC 700646 / DSM 10631 / Aspo-2) TaxID=643562 RepID=E6VTC9_PSEA9|nr:MULTISPECIES: FAD-binding protein [Pseudodesulfovibrio]MBU4193207.1 FAD-binding protein [Pseudomonadota bacterium]ADU63288.1 fumarate reductase/succinate dehydrogenase flavoprotein domain protein [Pseudodesulfovibrio aespoeensis Aspo-2]MBU4245342.1 FAD-binding protein [Pseudomonadota bacterium]MBU4378156.1 FAD-binding protein [Pseudomonadota bacterium]MBU4474975.1 FAD-binding protein [Pseudomonadota bacterium]
MPDTLLTPSGNPDSATRHTATDILVLGSGLAGLRAAWAAREGAPHLRVTVACLKSAPSGSSFTNRNNALGVQLLDTEPRQSAFCHEAIALGRPGFVNKKLVEILASESQDRVREMEALGLRLRRNPDGSLARFPGCGSHDPRAAIFHDLNGAFNQYRIKTDSCGVDFSIGTEILGIVTDAGAARGAWGWDAGESAFTAVRARAVILALGGPAPLFARHQAGGANPGLSLGLLADAGVKTANEPFLQFMWGREDASFLNPASLLAPGHGLRMPDGSRLDAGEALGPTLPKLRALRLAHCPAFHHQPQAALDRLLLHGLHQDGFARVETPNGVIKAGLYAHAGNGGSVVDEHGQTSLPGLFAIGECATGMHGANRLGGAMVLATQVFGRRAGLAAARYAAGADLMDASLFRNWCDESTRQCGAMGNGRRTRQAIGRDLSRYALFGGTPGDRRGLEDFRTRLTGLVRLPDRRTRLAALTALLVSRPTDDPFQYTP